jgi:hypothetical protein
MPSGIANCGWRANSGRFVGKCCVKSEEAQSPVKPLSRKLQRPSPEGL